MRDTTENVVLMRSDEKEVNKILKASIVYVRRRGKEGAIGGWGRGVGGREERNEWRIITVCKTEGQTNHYLCICTSFCHRQ